MGRPEGIRIYLRLRPPATAQHSSILGGGLVSGAGANAGTASVTRAQVAAGASPCQYYVENNFEGSRVHFHADRKLDSDVVNNTSEDYAFSFRRVFEPSTNQEDVFNVVAKDCVQSVLDGYNSTVFAYGQTGSGKTFSITGGTESYQDRGIIPRALGFIYDQVAKRDASVWTISVSYLQIYNDKGQDLLNHGKDAKTLDELPTVTVHEIDEDNTVLRNLEQHAAPTLTDALNLLFLGDTNRLYCETPMNRTSSRSHCVFTVLVEARVAGSSVVRKSKLNLVDLAGSERVSKTGVGGTILSEAKYINLSLHYLEHVIVALSEQAKGRRDHVPFRNSFMTMVLRDSLGGNCRTSMLATAHLAKSMLPETISTCNFAQRVATIQQDAHVNEEVDPIALIGKLKIEVAQLKDQLAFYQKQKDGTDANRELPEEEKLVCRGLVDAFVNAADPATARMEGFQGDLARIYYCFSIMRDLVCKNGGGGGGGGGAAGGRSPAPGASTGVSGTSPADTNTARLEGRIAQLQVALQQRENEVNTMFDLVSKAQGGARYNASTQTDADGSSGPSGTVFAVKPVRTAPAAAAAVATADALSRVTDLTQSGKLSAAQATAAEEYLRRKATLQGSRQQSGDEANTANPPATTSAAEPYNLAALSDAALLEDRAAAFDTFKLSCQQYAAVEATKSELKVKYDACKDCAAQLNGTVDTMKALKTQIQRLRAERAVEGVEEADPAEAALLRQLAQQREQYNALASSLRTQKESIDGMHAFMKRSQEQLAKDFEAWLDARKRQLSAVVDPAAGQAERQQPALVPAVLSSPAAATSAGGNRSAYSVGPPPASVAGARLPASAPSAPTSTTLFAAAGAGASSHGAGERASTGNGLPITAPRGFASTSSAASTTPLPPPSLGLPGGRTKDDAWAPASTRLTPPGASSPPTPLPLANYATGSRHGAAPTAVPAVASARGHHLQPLPGPDSTAHDGAGELAARSGSQASNPYAPTYRSTGNRAADEQLAALYKLRDSMRTQL